MTYYNYELKALLKHLVLDSDIENKIEFIGTSEQFKRAEEEISNYELE
jgi:hypothetical protein